MYWKDIYDTLQLSEVQSFMLSGQPPMIFQLLAINSIFMLLFIIRRMRNRGPKRHLFTTLQWILMFVNLGVLCQSNLSPYLQRIPDITRNF
jgi:hypothetical protein